MKVEQRCMNCGKLNSSHHTQKEVQKCIEAMDIKKNPHAITWIRLRRAGKIIREYQECTKFQLAEALENGGIPTGLPTIDKITPIIPQMHSDIFYKNGKFYVNIKTNEENSLSPETRGAESQRDPTRADDERFQSTLT